MFHASALLAIALQDRDELTHGRAGSSERVEKSMVKFLKETITRY